MRRERTVSGRSVDRRDRAETLDYLLATRPDVVVLAVRVRETISNDDTYLAEFLSENRADPGERDARGAGRPASGGCCSWGSSCVYSKVAA